MDGNSWTYMVLNARFFAPVFVILFLFFNKTIAKNIRLIKWSIVFAVVAFFIVDPFATSWGAWGYDYSKTLGIGFGKSVIEELVWAILVCIVLAIVVAFCADKEEKKKPFLKWWS